MAELLHALLDHAADLRLFCFERQPVELHRPVYAPAQRVRIVVIKAEAVPSCVLDVHRPHGVVETTRRMHDRE